MEGKAVVESLYAAVARGDTAGVAAVMAEDVEWWFHGPRRCQYMRRLLTGEEEGRVGDFRFRPRTVTAIGDGDECWVVAEGWEGKHAYWVHAWAVDADAAAAGRVVITRFREYFNTALTVHRLSGAASGGGAVWRSRARGPVAGRSLPELVLAI